MRVTSLRGIEWGAGVVLCALLAVGCATALPMTIQQEPLPKPEVTRSRSFASLKYRSVLIVPPEERRVGAKAKLIGKQDYNFFISKIERMLMRYGFRVISQDIVARIENRLKDKKQDTSTGSTYTRSEKAMVMGKETNADALLVVNTLDFKRTAGSYIEKADGSAMRPATAVELAQAAAQGRCATRFNFKSFNFEAKLIDVNSGDVLWIGSGQMQTPHMIPQDWVASIRKKGKLCSITAQNFDLVQYLANEAALNKQIVNLMEIVFRSFAEIKRPPTAPTRARASRR